MLGRFDQNDLQCRPDVRFENMTAMSGPIRFAENDMGMDLRSTVLESDITDELASVNAIARSCSPAGGCFIHFIAPIASACLPPLFFRDTPSQKSKPCEE